MCLVPGSKTLNEQFLLSIWIGWCMQYRKAASGSVTINNFSPQMPTLKRTRIYSINGCIRIRKLKHEDLSIDLYTEKSEDIDKR